jgi:hypothetical protein
MIFWLDIFRRDAEQFPQLLDGFNVCFEIRFRVSPHKVASRKPAQIPL